MNIKKLMKFIDWKVIGLFSLFFIGTIIVSKLSASYEGCLMLYNQEYKDYRTPLIIITSIISFIPLWFIRDIFLKKVVRR